MWWRISEHWHMVLKVAGHAAQPIIAKAWSPERKENEMQAGSPKQAHPRHLPFAPWLLTLWMHGVAHYAGWALGTCAAGSFKIWLKSFCLVSVEEVRGPHVGAPQEASLSPRAGLIPCLACSAAVIEVWLGARPCFVDETHSSEQDPAHLPWRSQPSKEDRWKEAIKYYRDQKCCEESWESGVGEGAVLDGRIRESLRKEQEL